MEYTYIQEPAILRGTEYMEDSVRGILWGVRWRCSANRMLQCISFSFFCFGLLTLAILLAEKLFAFGLITRENVVTLVAAAILIALVRWQLIRPNTMALALLLDKRANLRERTSSILSFKDSDDPFAQAAVHESRQAIAAVKPKEYFPLQLPRRFLWPVVIWTVILLAWLILPQGDLLGKQAKRQEQAQKKAEIHQTQVQMKKAVDKVRELAEKVDKNLAKDLPKEVPAHEPQQAKRLAVRQTADLQKRVQEVRSDPKFDGLKELQQRLKQIKSPDSGPMRELSQQLSRGQFDKAADALKELRQKLMQNGLSPEQRAELAKQLDDLAKQLDKLAQQQWKMDNELKQLGLDPKLAKDLKKLQEALKKLPLSEAQKKNLLQMAAANQSACKSCQGLSQAMESASAGMAGGKPDQAADAMAEANEQLNQLEALSQQLQVTEATLADLDQTMRDLAGEGNCPNCNGEGCEACRGGKGPWREGLSNKRSKDMGGPGRGEGHVADVTPEATNTEKKKVKGKSRGGPTIASWFVQDSKVKGESAKEFSDVAQSAQQEAAEAIENQTIPREYHDSVKKYFSQMQQSTNVTTTQKGN